MSRLSARCSIFTAHSGAPLTGTGPAGSDGASTSGGVVMIETSMSGWAAMIETSMVECVTVLCIMITAFYYLGNCC